MNHSVKVTVVADQHIIICGKVADIYKLRSVTLDGFGQAIGYVEESQEEFNCSEDYFKRDYTIFKCKVCGWSFPCGWSEAGLRPEVIAKMRDHVHLKHRGQGAGLGPKRGQDARKGVVSN